MSFFEIVHLDILAIGIFCLVNLALVLACYVTINKMKRGQRAQRRRIHNSEDDLKALFEAANSVGDKLLEVQQEIKFLKEQQEKLTLKEPSEQAYRNAIQALKSGESTSKVAENSGLSRGEVELLKLLQNADQNPSAKTPIPS